MTASVTINGTTTTLYTVAETKAAFATKGVSMGHPDGFKAGRNLKTYRIFSIDNAGAAKVMYAPEGFAWQPGVQVASATTATVRRHYHDKIQVDAIVAAL